MKSRRKFIKSGALFLPMIFVPNLIRAQSFGRSAAFLGASKAPLAGPPPFSYTAATLDGTNDGMHRGGAFTSIADGKLGLFSCWMNLNAAGDGGFQAVFYVDGANRIYLQNSDIHIQFTNITAVVNAGTLSGAIASGLGWFHFLAAWDAADSSKTHVYINGVADESIGSQTNSNVPYSSFTDWGVFTLPAAAVVPLNGCISEVYFDTRWLDITNATNRGYFRNSGTGKPVDVQTSNGGSWASGGQPTLYQHTYDGVNLGTGGNLSLYSGPFSSCTAP